MQIVFIVILISVIAVFRQQQLVDFDWLTKSVGTSKTESMQIENLEKTNTLIISAFDLGQVSKATGGTCPAGTRRWTHANGVMLCFPQDIVCDNDATKASPCLRTSDASSFQWNLSLLRIVIPEAHAAVPTVNLNVPLCPAGDPDCMSCTSPQVTCLTIPMCKVRQASCTGDNRFIQSFALPIPKSELNL
ncbi:hypothetical protein CIK05_11385 [Bdellovibrio sp. qaytius]|nr:hypothetical protein CIK05_11385 [Bdellovibrio sp. qaytius]